MKKKLVPVIITTLTLICVSVLVSLPRNWEEAIIGATSETAFIMPKAFYRSYISLTHPFKGDDYNQLGLAPLHSAIASCAGHFRHDPYCPELIENILKSGAKVNSPLKNKLGLCPLHLSVLHNDQDLFNFLIKHGADPEAKAEGEKFKDQNVYQFAQKLESPNFLK